MRGWLDRLAPRERALIAGGGLLLALSLLWAFLWQPTVARTERLRQVVAEQRTLVTWMEGAAARLEALRRQGTPAGAADTGAQSLLALVDASAREAGLGTGLTRVQPEGQDSVRVWLDRVPFDRLVPWLARLEGGAAVMAENATLEATDRPGEVTVRLTVARPGAGPAPATADRGTAR